MARRIKQGVERGDALTIEVNGAPLAAHAGETVATALLAAGITAFRKDRAGAPRGPVCNMGVCFECLVPMALRETDDFVRRRACMTMVRPGLRVRIGEE